MEGQGPEAQARPPNCDRERGILDLVGGAVDDASDDSGWAHLGVVGSILTKKAPDFDSRNYGYSKLSDLLEATKLFEFDRQDKAIRVRKTGRPS